MPEPDSNDAFVDADTLDAGLDGRGPQLVEIVGSMIRAEIARAGSGGILASFRGAAQNAKDRLRLAAVEALADARLTDWIDETPERREGAIRMALEMAPPDRGPDESAAALARLDAFADWDRYPFAIVLVPGYTPLDQRTAAPGVSDVTRGRLEEAVRALDEERAPFVMVSGGNVHPPGTPYHEGIEMKRALLDMGVDEEKILVEARARHSTTNLRNAGRFMVARGLARALVTAPGGGFGIFDQAFYFSHPLLSTFYSRCERELGYRVGSLEGAGAGRAAFTPAPEVTRIDYKDPMDP